MGKEQLLWQEQAQTKSVSKGKISLFYIFDVFQAHSGLLAYLPIIVVTICIFGGLSWQVFLPITDPARYQCYALTFWLGSSALALLPAGQCSFLSLTTSQPAFHLLPLEYPPLTLVLFSLALLAPLPYYQFAFALWMALVAALIYWLLRRYGPRNSAPVFALYLFLGAIPTAQQRFDLLPAALTLICIIAAERKHWNIAYIALAFGTLLKLYPALLLPALFIAEQQTKKLTPQGTAQGTTQGTAQGTTQGTAQGTHKGQDRSNKGSAGHPQGMPLQ